LIYKEEVKEEGVENRERVERSEYIEKLKAL